VGKGRIFRDKSSAEDAAAGRKHTCSFSRGSVFLKYAFRPHAKRHFAGFSGKMFRAFPGFKECPLDLNPAAFPDFVHDAFLLSGIFYVEKANPFLFPGEIFRDVSFFFLRAPGCISSRYDVG